jgi:coenzyme F420-dependent glucose-6-phosphate dehydrogenase
LKGRRALKLGYWLATEQHGPTRLLELATHAVIAGFDVLALSDHFHPWRDTGGQAPHPWIVMTAIAERFKDVEVGTAVTTPLFRYHPAIVAQAFATLDHMYPNRVFITVGTGHAMNEVPLGFNWPGYKEKVERLRESIEIMKLLWEDDFVDYDGKYYKLRTAKLYTKPRGKIRVYVATADAGVAKIAGALTDGILTNPRGMENFNALISAFEEGARSAGRDPMSLSLCLEFKVSYDIDYDRALQGALFWGPTAIPREKREKVWDPRVLESMVGEAEVEKIKKTWLITSDPDDIYKALGELMKLGFDRVYVHSSSPDEEKFLRMLGREILPWLREYYASLKVPLRVAPE